MKSLQLLSFYGQAVLPEAEFCLDLSLADTGAMLLEDWPGSGPELGVEAGVGGPSAGGVEEVEPGEGVPDCTESVEDLRAGAW